MKTTIERVSEFHTAFNQVDPETPELPTPAATGLYLMAKKMTDLSHEALERANETGDKRYLRIHLIQEELAELTEALYTADLTATLDALTDLQYVLDGTYLSFGLAKLKEPAFDEVHTSNMSKLGEDGKPLLTDGGRIRKGPNYKAPDLTQFFKEEKNA